MGDTLLKKVREHGVVKRLSQISLCFPFRPGAFYLDFPDKTVACIHLAVPKQNVLWQSFVSLWAKGEIENELHATS